MWQKKMFYFNKKCLPFYVLFADQYWHKADSKFRISGLLMMATKMMEPSLEEESEMTLVASQGYIEATTEGPALSNIQTWDLYLCLRIH